MRNRPAAKNISEVVDLYLADLSRLAKPRSVDKYGELLDKFVKYVGDKTPIDAVTYEMCVLFLNRWSGVSPRTGRPYAAATRAQHTSFLNQLFEFAYQHDYMETAMKKLVRPRLPKPEDRNVVIVSTGEVQTMFKACTSWGDEICLGILAYTGARRNAVSMLRWRDVDLVPDPPHGPHGWIKLQEKGGKYTEKPVPFFLRQILDRAPDHGADEYVVPNYRPGALKRKERSNAIIYSRVKRVAGRAGVNAHVHAIRAAFAVFFLENHKGSIKSLQDLLGHENIETTRHYLRNINKKQGMAEVLDLDWSLSFAKQGHVSKGVLSEGNHVESLPLAVNQGDTGSAGLAPDSSVPSERTPESALSETGLTSRDCRGEASGATGTPPPVSLSALSEGVAHRLEERHPGDHRHGDRAGVAALPPSESALGQSEGQERLVAHHMLPREPVKAHTGFEPVLLLQETVHAGSIEARHKLGHRTGHSLRV